MITSNHSFDLGPIMQLMDGIPDEIIHQSMQAAVNGMQRRIKRQSKTTDNSAIDANSPGWESQKAEDGNHTLPMQYTGRMTEPNAWSIESTGSTAIAVLETEHHEKWDTIHEIAERTGKNWDKVWGFSEFEVAMLMNWLSRGLKELLGISMEQHDFDISEKSLAGY